MSWNTNPLTINRCLTDIQQLVAAFPPGAPGLQAAVHNAAQALIMGSFPTLPEVRSARVLRAYAHAGNAIELAFGNNPTDPAWNACKQELEHAQNGD